MERPLLVTTELIKPIQERRKTETRRLRGLEVINEDPDKWRFWRTREDNPEVFLFIKGKELGFTKIKCPYGQPGDILWVRECCTWLNSQPAGGWIYKADVDEAESIELKVKGYKWRPSIHMPREASRMSLKIESIGVERLHDITEEAAITEGIESATGNFGYKSYNDYSGSAKSTFYPIDSFFSLWIKLNGVENWKINPWVWVLKFSLVKF